MLYKKEHVKDASFTNDQRGFCEEETRGMHHDHIY